MNAQSNSIYWTHPCLQDTEQDVRLEVEWLYFAVIRPHCFGETCVAVAYTRKGKYPVPGLRKGISRSPLLTSSLTVVKVWWITDCVSSKRKNKIRIREKEVPACLILTGSKPRSLIAASPFAIQNVPSPPDDNLVVFVEHPIRNEAKASQTMLRIL